MMVTFVSQCEKKALIRTRRVLDAFANRIGSNTWQTVITEEGLITVKNLLKKTATKNTAVSCHWIRSRSRSELVWIVGNRDQFNSEGFVAVNRTEKNLIKKEWENGWQSTEIIAIAASIAGLFHDFGKANDLFQSKLNPSEKNRIFEPYRHEWVSLRLFQAFVDSSNDRDWLNKLIKIDEKSEEQILKQVIKDGLEEEKFNNPFDNLPNFARLVAWLIVSHHHLPTYPKKGENEPPISNINNWLSNDFDYSWNSINYTKFNKEADKEVVKENWKFSQGTPLVSKTWQQRATRFGKSALNCIDLLENNKDWFEQTFIMHISRLSLMLADHCYSRNEVNKEQQDKSYNAYANTEKDNGIKKLKQKLDEHNIGVANLAYEFTKKFTKFREQLPKIENYEILSKGLRSNNQELNKWQDRAYKNAIEFQEKAKEQGFFGINIASTGKGKTLANARIMYGLSDKEDGCRFNIALGLRTLTLQTGKSLQKKLGLDKDEIAILIGSQAVIDLEKINQYHKDNNKENECIESGSESLNIGEDDDFEIIYNDSNVKYEGLLKQWFEDKPKKQKLLHAPILVSTIDYLTPATEGIKGGKQIAPMLRLLTSDLILDEPDEFNLDDLSALVRLVNWAGMLGSKVLLSTATMQPALAYTLFESYQEGRKSFNSATKQGGANKPIICGWFDEFDTKISEELDVKKFINSHNNFIDERVEKIKKEPILRKAKLINVNSNSDDLIINFSKTVRNSIVTLHSDNYQFHQPSNKKVSIGLVRMANIKPLVATACQLYSQEVPNNFRIHYCIYHSRYTLSQRSFIEKKLDQILNRKNPENIWKFPEVKQALNYDEENQIFVVLASPVTEVGRDHDYDWAIAEPSSMRSIIQLAGRIQRHRKQIPQKENFHILSKNYKALKGDEIAYEKPGFESKNRKLKSKDLNEILEEGQYKFPNSIPVIQSKLKKKDICLPFSNFVAMEHIAYQQKLLGRDEEDNARIWWKYNYQETKAKWSGEIQRRQHFRKNDVREQPYCLYFDENEETKWKIKNEDYYPSEYAETGDIVNFNELEIAKGNQSWFQYDAKKEYENLAENFSTSLEKISYKFGEIRLPNYKESSNEVWYYSEYLGVFKKI